ncbi:MAG: metallophosphoesterase [Flavobacteriales bacterium]|nr:metallophosphoesterase [Flavobacteriales bacterium]MBK7481409.1 metallophosphoesterase [Flavobacteriales bacterium]MBK9628827.1 metallophosphoesterase [Flavobacteriales bacterium]MBP9178364.1 metallophosphoesterase [Flavobacteriales bacterium]
MSPTALRNFAIFVFILVLIDLYAYKGVNAALANHSLTLRRLVRFLYWIVSIGILGLMIYSVVSMQGSQVRRDNSYVFSLVALFLLFFLPKLVIVIFHGLDDLLHVGRWIWSKLLPGPAEGSGEALDRANFLSQLGLIVASVPFVGVLYGVTKGRRSFNVSHIPVGSSNLPAAFHGLRIVQISDMHLGSYGEDLSIVQNGVDLINAEAPDLILFTGDLVNDYADEAERFIPALAELKARLGKFSILGNHDYSDYVRWEDPAGKAANLEKLKSIHKAMGFRLMLDEHLTLEQNGGKIGLLGVQNWGKRFQQYGDLAKTVRGTEELPYRILMSHDPTHWEEQVLATGIDLTLSGHTHGAQLGVKIGSTTYSPAQWVYKQWAGLYNQGQQQLYVNRGFGFIGFPGRVGMPPEITVLELQRT